MSNHHVKHGRKPYYLIVRYLLACAISFTSTGSYGLGKTALNESEEDAQTELRKCANNEESRLEMIISYYEWSFADDKALFFAHRKCLESEGTCVYKVRKKHKEFIEYQCGDDWQTSCRCAIHG